MFQPPPLQPLLRMHRFDTLQDECGNLFLITQPFYYMCLLIQPAASQSVRVETASLARPSASLLGQGLANLLRACLLCRTNTVETTLSTKNHQTPLASLMASQTLPGGMSAAGRGAAAAAHRARSQRAHSRMHRSCLCFSCSLFLALQLAPLLWPFMAMCPRPFTHHRSTLTLQHLRNSARVTAQHCCTALNAQPLLHTSAGTRNVAATALFSGDSPTHCTETTNPP